MISMTDLRERVNAAMRHAERAGKTDPAQELHEAFISAFPATPGTITVHTKTKEDGTPEVITYVTLTANTSTAGAYYLSEILNQLSEENG